MKNTGAVARFTIPAMTVCVLFGCGKQDKYPVYGTVTTRNGQPLANVVLEFAAIEGIHSAVARTKDDGSYVLSSDGMDDGAPSGAYRVRLIPADQESDYNEPEDEYARIQRPKRQLVPMQYQDFDTSGIQFTVNESGDNRFDIALDHHQTAN